MKLATIILASLLTAACNPGPPLSPLIGAARDGDTARIAELVRAGANVNERGGVNDWTPLMHAVHERAHRRFGQFLEKPPNPAQAGSG